MTAGIVTLLSVCLAFAAAGVVRKICVEAGEMVLLEHLKDDWTDRLPFRLKHNRYRGLNRSSYQLLAILYYTGKAGMILMLCVFYYILAGILAALKEIGYTGMLSFEGIMPKEGTEEAMAETLASLRRFAEKYGL